MKTQLIDTHAHLYVGAFSDDRAAMIQRAVEAGVSTFCLPAIDKDEHQALLKLADQYPENCKPMMGVHPCSITADWKEELEIAKKWLDTKDFIAVGEIGLDYYWDLSFQEQQKEAFRTQIQWSIEKNLPIVIHSRNATRDCMEIIKEFPKGTVRGIFHCFSDDAATGLEIIEMGFFLGIGGVITYKKSGLADAVKQLPLEWLVLETDAPYLPPVPFRGKRNESSYLTYIAQMVADVKELSLETVAEHTNRNAKKIFAI
ncbi:MAG: TatD family hydrolase [Chitinophagaceae bacterium]|uniref:TatD family hydrolase n=1 Tax=unclassified Paraflavitalea TaxID=2798305 RepID=UPI003D32C3AB|nr:TatD family hydrolase [Chitinophagaceae bacterium]